jgi:hypothetical protein
VRDLRNCDEIPRLHATACSVTEHERGARLVGAVQERVGWTERRVDLELLHRDDAVTPALRLCQFRSVQRGAPAGPIPDRGP